MTPFVRTLILLATLIFAAIGGLSACGGEPKAAEPDPDSLPVALLLLCDGTGVPERSCTPDYLAYQAERWARVEPLERERELVVITSAADYGSTIAWPTHRHDGAVRGHRRLFAEDLVDQAQEYVAQVVIPVDPPAGQTQSNQSHLMAALTLISRIAGEYRRRGYVVEFQAASDGRFIGGEWNVEKTVPTPTELWATMGATGEQFDLSPLSTATWCGLHNLSSGSGERSWTFSKDRQLERLLVGLFELSGGSKLDTRRDCTVPSGTGVDS